MSNTLKLGNGKWATGKDTLLSFSDTNNNYKPLPFSFSRASSGTVINKAGLIETVGSGEPRIDFKDNTKGALLLEPSRSNLVTYSEDTTEWDKNETPINTSNTTISPNGSQNADSVIVNSTSEGFYDFSVGTVQSGTSYTFSIFIKYISGIETIRFGGSGGGFGGDNNNVFNIKNGTVVSAASGNTLSVDDYGNGWYRLIATKTASSTATAAWILYGNENAEIQYSAWGVQVEQGSYATSYIPTSGSAVTRVADVCNNGANEQVINSTEGVLYWEASALADDGTDRRIALSDGTLNNYVSIGYSRFSGNIIAEMFSGGVIQTTDWGATGFSQTNNNKFAMSWGSGTMKFYINGVQKQTASVTSPIGMNNLRFSSGNGHLIMFSNTKDLRVYNTALTDQELITLTQ